MDNRSARPKSVSGYIASCPKEVQSKLQTLRQLIQKAAPEAEEFIGYGMPAYKQGGALVYFGLYKNHIGFYPTSSGIEEFKDEIGKYKWSKGAVQFPLDQPLPQQLITRIVRHRVEANRLKKASKREK